ncbi:MAG: RluA family pseudouridine synthase [Verrucomicrobiota bacterium]|jgi:23S rRNA pseudouridine1911/1915/1917 synthase
MAQPDTMVLERTLPNERLDRHLASLVPGVSRAAIQRLILEGRIKVNGTLAKPTRPPRAGDVVTFFWPAPKPAEAQPQDIPLEVLHEDADIIVVNKPAELVVHPSAGHDDGTLVNALLHHCAGELSGVGGVERPGIVHRLDLGTSGCLVVAKNDRAHVWLNEQFQTRKVEKFYQCIVCGVMDPSVGDVSAPLARHPTHRKRMAVVPGGRDARTSWRRLERFDGASFVEAQLHTGRTHQIRVHFQHVGFPIFGDDVYGRGPTARLAEATGIHPSRQLLHARRLTLWHPRTRRLCEFNAPLPPDFREALEALREVAPPSDGPRAIS